MKAAFLCIMMVSVVVSVAKAYKEPCINDGQEYAHDDVFLDADCNKCQCNDGNTLCEMNAEGCPEEESCIYDGQEYAHDEVFLDDDCNKCQCDDGNTICEMNAEGCPEVCEYNGNRYEAGESFPDDDGCNTCNCLRGGAVACTLMLCLDTPIPLK